MCLYQVLLKKGEDSQYLIDVFVVVVVVAVAAAGPGNNGSGGDDVLLPLLLLLLVLLMMIRGFATMTILMRKKETFQNFSPA